MPIRFSNNADTELIFSDGSSHPWVDYFSNWAQLSSTALQPGFCTTFDPDNGATGEPGVEQEMACDFGTAGLWQYNYGTANSYINEWTQLTTSNAVSLVSSNYYHEAQTTFVANFGPGVGVWTYHPSNHYWWKLTDLATDSAMSW